MEAREEKEVLIASIASCVRYLVLIPPFPPLHHLIRDAPTAPERDPKCQGHPRETPAFVCGSASVDAERATGTPTSNSSSSLVLSSLPSGPSGRSNNTALTLNRSYHRRMEETGRPKPHQGTSPNRQLWRATRTSAPSKRVEIEVEVVSLLLLFVPSWGIGGVPVAVGARPHHHLTPLLGARRTDWTGAGLERRLRVDHGQQRPGRVVVRQHGEVAFAADQKPQPETLARKQLVLRAVVRLQLERLPVQHGVHVRQAHLVGAGEVRVLVRPVLARKQHRQLLLPATQRHLHADVHQVALGRPVACVRQRVSQSRLESIDIPPIPVPHDCYGGAGSTTEQL
uniref:Uncharacterized protein n=1 Tax=Anopheles atroparvus TaxID=41427 RepID=A0A182IKE2_ANOAO